MRGKVHETCDVARTTENGARIPHDEEMRIPEDIKMRGRGWLAGGKVARVGIELGSLGVLKRVKDQPLGAHECCRAYRRGAFG